MHAKSASISQDSGTQNPLLIDSGNELGMPVGAMPTQVSMRSASQHTHQSDLFGKIGQNAVCTGALESQ